MESTGFHPVEEKTATASAGSRAGARSKPLQTPSGVASARQLVEHKKHGARAHKTALEGKIEVHVAQFWCPRSWEGCAGRRVGAGLEPPPALGHTRWASGPRAHTEFNRDAVSGGAASGCCLKTSILESFAVLWCESRCSPTNSSAAVPQGTVTQHRSGRELPGDGDIISQSCHQRRCDPAQWPGRRVPPAAICEQSGAGGATVP